MSIETEIHMVYSAVKTKNTGPSRKMSTLLRKKGGVTGSSHCRDRHLCLFLCQRDAEFKYVTQKGWYTHFPTPFCPTPNVPSRRRLVSGLHSTVY